MAPAQGTKTPVDAGWQSRTDADDVAVEIEIRGAREQRGKSNEVG
jgi:hypothetical protein